MSRTFSTHGRLLGGTALMASLACLSPARAQEPASNSLIGKPIYPSAHAVDVPVHLRTPSQMDAFAAAHPELEARARLQNLPPRPTMGEDAYRAAKDAANAGRGNGAKPSRQADGIAPQVAPGTVILNKAGPNATMAGNGFYPPDTTGAIGTTQIVFPVNQTLNVYGRGGGLQKSVSFNSFFGTTDSLSDPRIRFDATWQRWVLTDTRVPQPGHTVSACFWVAVSVTSSATGSWHSYRPCISGGEFAAGDLWDYDMLGLSQDAILVTGNIFGTSSFKGPAIIAMPKAALYNGLGFSAPVYTLPTTVGTVAPPDVQDSNANAFFLAADSNGSQLDLYRGTNLSNEGQFSFTLQATPAASYSVPPSALQPGTSQTLDTLDGRFQQTTTQYGNTLWAVHTSNLDNFPAPIFYQLDTNASTIVQSGFFYESGTSDDFNPSIVANSGGGVFVTWSSTDALSTTGFQHDAYVRYSGRQAGDAAGVIGAGSVVAGSSVPLTSDGGSVQRWGDYSAVTLDPVASSCGAGQRAAIFNEKIINSNTWGTEFALVGFCP